MCSGTSKESDVPRLRGDELVGDEVLRSAYKEALLTMIPLGTRQSLKAFEGWCDGV